MRLTMPLGANRVSAASEMTFSAAASIRGCSAHARKLADDGRAG